MKLIDRSAIQDWAQYHKSLVSAATIDDLETIAEQHARMMRLEADPESWFAYYFPKYSSSPPASFHRKATKRILINDRWYEVRAWSRELAKSTRTMFETLYLAMTGKVFNVLMISSTEDNAIRLLKPYKINLESNHRIQHDYGLQENFGSWGEEEFITKKGVSFRAIGAGQNPRGTRNEEMRADMILVDDIDTDEECRNPVRIEDKWKWIEKALLPTLSISGRYRIIFCGNIISRDCTITRAIEKAHHSDVINIRDAHGKSTWPEKNSEADIDEFLNMFSFAAQQQEFFNNPIVEGTVFKEIIWDKVPPLNRFKFLVAYGDPAPSNKENKANCYKSLPLIGAFEGKFYVLTCYLQQVKNSEFVRWYYYIEDYVGHKTQIYNYIENNSLQDPFYEQVFVPLFMEEGRKTGHEVYVSPDERKKPDKYARIEGNLEPLNRQGRLIFNIAEKNNPHMVRLAEQFKAVEPRLSSPIDGPDSVEGGIWIINNKLVSPSNYKWGNKITNHKRY
jgi:hypothetical protein